VALCTTEFSHIFIGVSSSLRFSSQIVHCSFPFISDKLGFVIILARQKSSLVTCVFPQFPSPSSPLRQLFPCLEFSFPGRSLLVYTLFLDSGEELAI